MGHFNSPQVRRLVLAGHLNGHASLQQILSSEAEQHLEVQGPFSVDWVGCLPSLILPSRVPCGYIRELPHSPIAHQTTLCPLGTPQSLSSLTWGYLAHFSKQRQHMQAYQSPTYSFLSFFQPCAVKSFIKFYFALFKDVVPWVKSLQKREGTSSTSHFKPS